MSLVLPSTWEALPFAIVQYGRKKTTKACQRPLSSHAAKTRLFR